MGVCGDLTMEKEEYKKLFELENSYWWYVGRRFIIKNILKKYATPGQGQVLDVGCGTGMNLGLLSPYGSEVLGIDTSPEALNYCRQRGFSNVKIVGDLNDLKREYGENTFSLITMLDVLEHIEDDDSAIKNVYHFLDKNGIFILTVPAYQFLWSEHDTALHHKRRYTAKLLAKKLENNGFKIVKSSYIIVFTFPLIVAYRILKGIFNIFSPSTPKTSHVILPNFINNLLILPLKLEGKLIDFLDFPFGTSVIIVAKKPIS